MKIFTSTKVKAIVIILLSLGAIVGLFWFAGRYGGGEMSRGSEPQVICQPQNAPVVNQECFWSTHWHFGVKVVNKQGEEVSLRFEQGDLEETHTHSDNSVLHWHRLIPVDPETQEVTDWSELMVREIPEDLGLSLEGEPRFIVNGQEVAPDYILKNHDEVEVRYE